MSTILETLLPQDMTVAAVTVRTTRSAKLESNHHHQYTETLFLQAGCPSCHLL